MNQRHSTQEESRDRWTGRREWTELVERMSDPAAARVALGVIAAALENPAQGDRMLAPLVAGLPAQAAAIWRRNEAGWQITAQAGPAQNVSREFLTEALDANTPHTKQNLWAGPTQAQQQANELLVLQFSAKKPPPHSIPLSELALVVGQAYAHANAYSAARERAEHLEAILDASREWHQTGELEPLLTQIAQTASSMLAADRASIFLWDRPRKLLIGKPALGVPGGELRIPDNVGVVGQVLSTGQPMRASPQLEPNRIDHQVDQQTGYRTESVLCVPLRAPDGQLLGVFEVMNKRGGPFTDADETALVELARHAAISVSNTQERTSLIKAHREIASEAARRVQLIGQSPAIEALKSMITQVALSDLAVLVLGENGTGKEVVSQAIHYHSRRSQQPFVAVNCAALSESLLESELFGHEQGAFTDAKQARPGKFESASGGTLFLDEIGELSRGGQAKLLRVLEEKVVVRVGGVRPISTDARVIAATNRNLAEMVRRKEFREDLYYRLNVISLELPPLRNRGDDVLELAQHYLVEFAARAGRTVQKLTLAAKQRLREHTWPGNVRELRNLIERLVYLLPAQQIDARDISFAVSADGRPLRDLDDDLPLAEATDAFQTEYIQRAIDRCQGRMVDAAKQLGLHRANLYRKMRVLGMSPKDE